MLPPWAAVLAPPRPLPLPVPEPPEEEVEPSDRGRPPPEPPHEPQEEQEEPARVACGGSTPMTPPELKCKSSDIGAAAYQPGNTSSRTITEVKQH